MSLAKVLNHSPESLSSKRLRSRLPASSHSPAWSSAGATEATSPHGCAPRVPPVDRCPHCGGRPVQDPAVVAEVGQGQQGPVADVHVFDLGPVVRDTDENVSVALAGAVSTGGFTVGGLLVTTSVCVSAGAGFMGWRRRQVAFSWGALGLLPATMVLSQVVTD
ncbi:hypothetical protein [Streptomyces verrucosisporus]|uniref:hypothetical protein n=1 Tax=Streptomyces verrucosisporus TaxID=1695161 RepID=UPI001F1239A3|nr:hypothetical protein [Streptomyces verrucosisporus]